MECCVGACHNRAVSIKVEDPAYMEEAVARIGNAVDVT